MKDRKRSNRVQIIIAITSVMTLIFGSGVFWRFISIDKISDGETSTASTAVSSVADTDITSSTVHNSSSGEHDTNGKGDGDKDHTSESMTTRDEAETNDSAVGEKTTVRNPYEDYAPISITPYNADEFTIRIEKKMARLLTDGAGEWEIGIVPTESIPIEIDLIDYNSGQTVEKKTAYIGDDIRFVSIPAGTYYYVVSCDGYKKTVPNEPFVLRKNESTQSDVLSWIAYLEESHSSFTNPFKIQIFDEYQNPIVNKDISLRVVDKNNPNPYSFSSQPLKSNEDGYLTLWMGINGVDHYYLIDFFVLDHAILQIEKEDGSFLDIQPNGAEIRIAIL